MANTVKKSAHRPPLQGSVGRPVDPDKDTAILAAARHILFERGPQAVTMEAVAAEAGVSKATVYSRHANKTELIRAVVRHHGQRIVGHFAAAPGSHDDVRASLGGFARQLLDFLSSDEHIMLVRAAGSAQALAPDMVREIYINGPQNTLEQLAQWLGNAAAARLLDCPEPLRSAELLMGMLCGIDWARTLFGLPPAHRGARLDDHADFVVDAFLQLHGPDSPRER